jgi:hypothetical protein
VAAPFTVAPDSLFTYQVRPGSNSEPPELATVTLGGRGTATVRFRANTTEPVWEFTDRRWDFAPTPEPSTLVLLGGGLAVLVAGKSARDEEFALCAKWSSVLRLCSRDASRHECRHSTGEIVAARQAGIDAAAMHTTATNTEYVRITAGSHTTMP